MRATKTHSRSQNRFMRIITIPIRALGRARDFYVRSMNNAERMGYGTTVGGAQFAGLPKSFSVRPSSSSDGAADDYAELVRAASARSYGSRIDVDAILSHELRQTVHKTTPSSVVGPKGLPKCSSVGMGKIDEDKACDFDEDAFCGSNNNNNKKNNNTSHLFPRSQSYAVAKRRLVL